MQISAPLANCSTAPPGTPEFWCVDPIQQRRGTQFGFALQTLSWQDNVASPFNSLDVGSLPAFTTAPIQVLGDVNFNNAGVLANCPMTPAPVAE